MKVIYLGYAVNKDDLSTYSGVSVAGNNMQVSLLSQLNQDKSIDLHVITVPPVGSFPKDKKLIYKSKESAISKNIKTNEIGFVNLPLIKQFLQTKAVYRQAKNLVDKDTTILTFNMFMQVSDAAVKLKNKFGCKLVCILADPPIDIVKRSVLSKILKDNFFRKAEKNIKLCDSLIVLNSELINIYAPNKKHIVIDGAIDPDEFLVELAHIKTNHDVVFSGALTEYNGILELIKTAELLKDYDYKFFIYGDGPLKGVVISNAKQMPNLIYGGVLNNIEMKKKQSEAFLLINPRRVDDPMSRLTFPSKILEYMVSGTPILTTKLNGFSADYFDKMFFTNTNNPNEMAEKLKKIHNLPTNKLLNTALNAQTFVLKEKNWTVQGKKIIDFLKMES